MSRRKTTHKQANNREKLLIEDLIIIETKVQQIVHILILVAQQVSSKAEKHSTEEKNKEKNQRIVCKTFPKYPLLRM